MDTAILKTELLTDPLSRGYSGMSDVAAAADLNTVYRQINKVSMTGSEVLNALDTTEVLALTDAQRQRMWNVLHLGTINPFGMEASIFIDVFGGGSNSISALQVARKTDVSRGVELGLGNVREGEVAEARRS